MTGESAPNGHRSRYQNMEIINEQNLVDVVIIALLYVYSLCTLCARQNGETEAAIEALKVNLPSLPLDKFEFHGRS